MAKSTPKLKIPTIQRGQIVALVVLLVVVGISYIIISNWIDKKSESKEEAEMKNIFGTQNLIAYSPSPNPITQTAANAFVARIIEDAEFFSEDQDVYYDLNVLDNANLITVNNAFVSNFASDFEYKYTNLKNYIQSNNLYTTPIMDSVLQRLP